MGTSNHAFGADGARDAAIRPTIAPATNPPAVGSRTMKAVQIPSRSCMSWGRLRTSTTAAAMPKIVKRNVDAMTAMVLNTAAAPRMNAQGICRRSEKPRLTAHRAPSIPPLPLAAIHTIPSRLSPAACVWKLLRLFFRRCIGSVRLCFRAASRPLASRWPPHPWRCRPATGFAGTWLGGARDYRLLRDLFQELHRQEGPPRQDRGSHDACAQPKRDPFRWW
jgi:hypothetical protein